jgi:hypothetical protein
MSNRITNIIALSLLVVMFLVSISSMSQSSLTFDELAHIPAGYSYLKYQDYRINPEHPPLIKNITAIPLLFLDLDFPSDHSLWTQEKEAPAWWVQFDLGREFIYHSGNNPREIIFWSRFAMIILLLTIGCFLFFWAQQIGGNIVAIGTLTLFSFSPTFLAHGQLVNTDIGAVLGTLISIFFWLKFLKMPNWQNIVLAGISFGIAMLLKFSLILLIPFFVIITIIYAISFKNIERKILTSITLYVGKAFLAALIGIIFIVWPVYQIHVLNYPLEHQLRDTMADISNHPVPIMKDINFWMIQQQPLRGLAQYLRGLLMASQRTMWGNNAVFMGEISTDSWLYYFPALYLFKIPLAFHILFLMVLGGIFWKIKKPIKEKSFCFWIKNNFIITAFLIWVSLYWTAALVGNLNIGIRHLLPIFPFVYILVIWGLVRLISSANSPAFKKYIVISASVLFVWYIGSSLSTFPHYIPYYNELAGGTNKGYKIAVDSNYDWGQDFYRLLNFIEEKEINEIHLDYFGGEDPQYWLKEKYIELNPKEIKEPPKGWVAVSLNQLMGGIAEPAPNFNQETGYYQWLENYQPVARAGKSMFVYYID